VKTQLPRLVQTGICPGCGRPVYERLGGVPIERVIEIVGKFYGVAQADLVGSDRSQHVAMVRHIAMYLARTHCRLSYPELGGVFGRDHSSVIHGVHAIERRIQAQPAFAKFLARLEDTIRDGGEGGGVRHVQKRQQEVAA
jgi:Bacterial dnaA protein helix-turn-helix